SAPSQDSATDDRSLALTRYRRSTAGDRPEPRRTDEVVDKVLEVVRWAPSAGSWQP
ncbi:MAG: hypothetical protein QOI36_2862, partial [Pseudonocardiales bacterium]|nr:hypothetical protein [Pseudonocardiales bacterium]